MLIVSDLWEDAKKIFGFSNPDLLYRRINDAIELLANKGEFDPGIGYVDICVDSGCVTLPREVETPLAVNINGRPSLGRDVLFKFHLNGPGDFDQSCGFTWADGGNFCTYRDIKCPLRLVAHLDKSEDSGSMLRVFGFDDQNRPLQTKVGDVYEEGHLVPTIYGYAMPDPSAPLVSRITGIVKDVTAGVVRLSSYDNSTFTGTLLGIYEPDETRPTYRRIRLGHSASWARVCYRKRTYQVRTERDRINLHSRLALVLAMRAVKFYDDTDLANALAYEANALRLLSEKEYALTPPVGMPLQVDDRNAVSDDGDTLD